MRARRAVRLQLSCRKGELHHQKGQEVRQGPDPRATPSGSGGAARPPPPPLSPSHLRPPSPPDAPPSPPRSPPPAFTAALGAAGMYWPPATGKAIATSTKPNILSSSLPSPPLCFVGNLIQRVMSRSMSITLLLAFAAVASALLPTARPYTTPTRASRAGQPLLAEPATQAQGVDECIVDAENAAELSACADPADPSLAPTAGATVTGSGVSVSAESKRKALMGPAGSLQECLSEAEGGAEVDECKLDYDQLVSGPGEEGDSDMLNVGPIALVVIGVALAAANLIGG